MDFAHRFGEAHLTLACHAAFPLALTPDLLYRIWANFVPQAPWTAVADVLLSRLCREVGYELYEMDVAVRNLLLQELKENYGQQCLKDLADFLSEYTARQLRSDAPDVHDLAEAQQWTALAHSRKDDAAREVAKALSELVNEYASGHRQESMAELIRVASLVETLAEPLVEFTPLLIYAQGMANLARGDLKRAVTQFGKVFEPGQREISISGVRLPIPPEAFQEKAFETPIYRLAEQVLRNNLTLAEALEQVASESILAQVDDIAINQLDDYIRALTEQVLEQATVLAVLNCQAARYKANDAVWGNCNGTLGRLYQRQGQLELALRHYQEALSIFEPMPRAEKVVVQIRLDIGEIKERQGYIEAAQAEYRTVLELARWLAHPQLESDALNGLGRVYLAQGYVDDALVTFQRALELSRQEHDLRGAEKALGNLGLAHHFLGRLTEAAECHRQALVLSRDIGHQAGTGHHLSHLGNVLLELDELSEAEACFLEAVDIARQSHDRRGERQRLGNLGNLYQARAEQEIEPHRSKAWLDKAKQYHQDTLESAREQGDRRSQADHLLDLGNVYSKLNRSEEAQECYTEALSLAEAQDVVDTQWRVHYAWGNLCAAQLQDQLAFDHYAVALQIVESQRSQLKIESRTKFWQGKTSLYKQMVLCCLRLGKLWIALEYTEQAKTRYLADLLAERLPSPGDTQTIIQATLAALSPHTAVVIFNVTETGTAVFIATDRQSGSARSESVDNWQESPDGRIRVRLMADFGQDDLQRILLGGDNLIHVTAERHYRDKTYYSGKASDGYLVDYYADLARWREFTLEPVSAEIYKTLLAPVHRELIRLSIEQVVFMPNLGLSLLPLHACYKVNGTKRDYLLDHYEIMYAPSFDILFHCQRQARPELPDDGHLFAVANPTGDLIWTNAEVERITRLFSAARVLGSGEEDRATIDAVLTEAPDYTFIHFACHGSFDLREPFQSGLLLVPPELLTLDTVLKHLKLPYTRLVVLSAAETGLVDPSDLADEYIGLQVGFLFAGAPAVVSPLWAIDDLATRLLMERFYANHIVDGMSLPTALRRAQLWLRDEVTAAMVAEILLQIIQARQAQSNQYFTALLGAFFHYDRMAPDSRPFAHPFYWAGFTLMGT